MPYLNSKWNSSTGGASEMGRAAARLEEMDGLVSVYQSFAIGESLCITGQTLAVDGSMSLGITAQGMDHDNTPSRSAFRK
ncbi:MAG: hypothetical protein ABJI96_05760 [Paracoccaceae bacterium]